MKKQIKARIKKGWKPTKKQVEWIQETFLPQYENGCGYCWFNLLMYLGLESRLK